jgi:sortase A
VKAPGRARIVQIIRWAMMGAGVICIALALWHEINLYPWGARGRSKNDIPFRAEPPDTVSYPGSFSGQPMMRPASNPDTPNIENDAEFLSEAAEYMDQYYQEIHFDEEADAPVIGKNNSAQSFIGRIAVEALNIHENLYEGTTNEQLYKGVGHLPYSAMPGDVGNCVVSAHRSSSSGMEPFRYLNLLNEGDRVVIEINHQTFIYEVYDIFIVQKEDTWVLYPDSTERNLLTLITCDPLLYPGGNRPNRLIARARLMYVDEENKLQSASQ